MLIDDLKEKGIINFLRSYLATGKDGQLASLRKLLIGLGIVPVCLTFITILKTAKTSQRSFDAERKTTPNHQNRAIPYPPTTSKTASIQLGSGCNRSTEKVEENYRPLWSWDIYQLRDTRLSVGQRLIRWIAERGEI